MARIRTQEIVPLDTGGSLDLKGCDVLWAPPWLFGTLSWHWRLFPGGRIFARMNHPILVRTPTGALVVTAVEFGPPTNPLHEAWRVPSRQIVWRAVSPSDAYLWLRQQKNGGWHARRFFPEFAAEKTNKSLVAEDKDEFMGRHT